MKNIVNLFIILNFASISYAQIDKDSIKADNSFVFKLIPTAKDNVYGIALGLVGSETVCNIPTTKKSHGINIQVLGQGLFIPLNPRAFGYKINFSSDSSFMVKSIEDVQFKAKHNGLLISTFGTMTEVINGLSISGLSSLGYYMNGLGVNVLSSKYRNVNGVTISINNVSYKVNGIQLGIRNRSNKLIGIQLGLFNRANELRGFQFGLWNINEKRQLPFINWNFN